MIYERPPEGGALRQGEILRNVWEHRSIATTPAPPDGPPLESVHHPLVVILTADCDLDHDFDARFPNDEQLVTNPDDPRLVPYLLLVDLYDESSLRSSLPGGDIFRRIKASQDERYHHLVCAKIGRRVTELPDLYADFKKTIALSTASVYQGIAASSVRRVAVVPPIYVHDLIHRFYGFLSRVGVD